MWLWMWLPRSIRAGLYVESILYPTLLQRILYGVLTILLGTLVLAFVISLSSFTQHSSWLFVAASLALSSWILWRGYKIGAYVLQHNPPSGEED